MPRKPKPKHIHIYYGLRSGKTWRCTKEGCTHMITGSAELMYGRNCECPYCHVLFIIDKPEMLRRRIIHCGKCTYKGIKIGEEIEEPKAPKVSEDIFAALLKEKNIG